MNRQTKLVAEWTNVANVPYRAAIENRVAQQLIFQAGSLGALKKIYDSACRHGGKQDNPAYQEFDKMVALAKYNAMSDFKETDRNAAEFSFKFVKQGANTL